MWTQRNRPSLLSKQSGTHEWTEEFTVSVRSVSGSSRTIKEFGQVKDVFPSFILSTLPLYKPQNSNNIFAWFSEVQLKIIKGLVVVL